MTFDDFFFSVQTVEHLLRIASDRTISFIDRGSEIIAEISQRPRLMEAYYRLVVEGWQLKRENIIVGNSYAENKVLYIDDDDEPVQTLVTWVEDAVREAYRENESVRLAAILKKGLEIFDQGNGLTDLESMARLYDWASWFWVDRTGSVGEIYRFTADMMLVLTERSPYILPASSATYYILDKPHTREGSTGFKREYRDASSQVRHATMSIRAAVLGGVATWFSMNLRDLAQDNPADWRLNGACQDIAGRLLTSLSAPLGIGAILRTELGDPTEQGPWIGPRGGDPL